MALERELADLRAEWADELEASLPQHTTTACAPLAYRAIAPVPLPRRSSSCSAAGSRTRARPCRGSALIALEGALARPSRRRQRVPRRCSTSSPSRDPNAAVRRLAIVCFKNGTPARETILILDGIADDDETDAEVRKTARSVVAAARQEVEPEVGRGSRGRDASRRR